MKNVTKTNVLFTATVLVYIILMHSVQILYSAEWFPDGALSYNFLLILPELILLLPSFVYVAFLMSGQLEECGMSTVSVSTGVATVFMAFGLIPLVSLINMISSFFVDNTVSDTLTTLVNENGVFVNLILVALIPAIVEEFIFRGLIFNGYKKRNPLMAMLLSAFLFGLIHMNINQFSYAFIIGVIFAMLTYATGSIIPSIIAHFVINGNSVVLSHVLDDMAKSTTDTEALDAVNGQLATMDETMIYAFVIGALVIMTIAGGVVAFLLFRYICKKNRGVESVKMIFKKGIRGSYAEEEGKFFDGYLWLGVGLCLVYIIMYDVIR